MIDFDYAAWIRSQAHERGLRGDTFATAAEYAALMRRHRLLTSI